MQDLVSYEMEYLTGVVLERAVPAAGALPELAADIVAVTRMVFNPLYFGMGFLMLFVWAWFRMEAIAEKKRTSTNVRMMAKRSVGALRISLMDYSDKYNGEIFLKNKFFDVINSIKSNGRIPLKAASICQPVLPSLGENVLWKSNCVQVMTVPVITGRDQFLQAVRETAVLSIRDALHIVAMGGTGHWRDPRKRIFSKVRLVSLKFNFFDQYNFMCIYQDRHGFKRICSESVEDFFCFESVHVESQELIFSDKNKKYGVGKIKIIDEIFFSAIALLLCYAHPL